MADRPLTTKQESWLTAFITCGNATQAAITAGYSTKSARLSGHRNITNANIVKEIARRIGPKLKAQEVETDRILKELSAVAFTPLDECVDYGPGRAELREPKDMTEAARHAVKSVKVKRRTTLLKETGQTTTSIETEITMHSKTRALDLLAKVTNMINQAEKVQIFNLVNIAALFTAENADSN
jgi:phage terminase small subunit